MSTAPSQPPLPSSSLTLTWSSKADFLRGEGYLVDRFDVDGSLVLGSLDDDYDDNDLNYDRWTYVPTWEGQAAAPLIESGGVLSRPYGTGYYNVLSVSNAPLLEGDFDLKVDYNLTRYPDETGARIGLRAICQAGGTTNAPHVQFALNDVAPDPGDKWRIETWVSAAISQTRRDITNTQVPSGRLRIQRVGTQVQFYYWEGGAYQPVPPVAYPVSGDCWVLLATSSYSRTGVPTYTFSAYFDNGDLTIP